MTADDVIAGARGKPVPFEFGGFTYLLRPLTRSEMLGVFEVKDGYATQAALLALAVCDESGVPVLSESDVPELPNAAIDAVAREILRRNGVDLDGGKADSSKTPA